MSDNELLQLNEQILRDIIVCDPVTNKGLDALGSLGLSTQDVSVDDFFTHMYVRPRYDENDEYEIVQAQTGDFLTYPYSVSQKRFEELKEEQKKFQQKFGSNAVGQTTLIILGTSGCGKSVYANSLIRHLAPAQSNYMVYDLERSWTSLTHEIPFTIPAEDALWLFFMSLLKGFWDLIDRYQAEVTTISKNHVKYFQSHHSADHDEVELFSSIRDYNPDSAERVERLALAIKKTQNDSDASASIRRLLCMTMNFMYCVNPSNKNYLVFDNVEYYIAVNTQHIPIPNNALTVIYQCVSQAIGNISDIYDRIRLHESGKAFKAVLVLRRSTGRLLRLNAHYPTRSKETNNNIDHTGHVNVWQIWAKKKQHIWARHLESAFDKEQSSAVIRCIDNIMDDTPQLPGTSYQELISPLMNHGIRCNAHTQAHAAMELYDILYHKKYSGYLTSSEFETLMRRDLETRTPETRYLYRRALLEFNFKWMVISRQERPQIEQLFLGKLSGEKDSNYKDATGAYIKIRDVVWEGTNKRHATLVRRVLSCLSNHVYSSEETPEDSTRISTFETVSLYDLMSVLFLNPSENKDEKALTAYEHFLPLSKVLLSLGNLSYQETKRAPMVILSVDDDNIAADNPEQGLASLLQRIWDAGQAGSDSGKYKSTDYGVYLTDSGRVFLEDIQPSFSFFAALYCSEEVPLFFLKDAERIKQVISRVYRFANDLCNAYEAAATGFCGPGVTLDLPDYKYLPQDKDGGVTFRRRVKELHVAHLHHYRRFIESNFDDGESLLNYIDDYVSQYNRWIFTSECF